ncbi:MAG: exo-alpha-sialidase [Pseudomonadota bacterium]
MELHVATRKGLFVVRPGSNQPVGQPSFLGDPVTAVLHDRRDGTLYAALNLGHFGRKLHRSTDGGASWAELPAPAFDKVEGKEDGPSVSLVWTLEAGGDEQPGRLWAGTIPGALFRSDDHGESWQLVRSLWDLPQRKNWFGGGYDDPGIHSILVDPRDSRRVECGVSCGGVTISEDDGASWRQTGHGFVADYVPPEQASEPSTQDPHRVQACSANPNVQWCQHHSSVYRSTDGGDNWTELTEAKPSRFGFAVAAHPHDPETAWFVPGIKDERRVPVDGKLVVSRTRDGGKSFEILSNGLPTEPSFDLIYRHALDIDDTGECLAMGSTTGNLWISENGGDEWRLVSNFLPPVYQVSFA